MKKTILRSFIFAGCIVLATSCHKEVKTPKSVNNSNATAKNTTTTTQTTTTATTNQGGHTCGGDHGYGGQ